MLTLTRFLWNATHGIYADATEIRAYAELLTPAEKCVALANPEIVLLLAE